MHRDTSGEVNRAAESLIANSLKREEPIPSLSSLCLSKDERVVKPFDF